jgi:hypothetical protein
MMTPERKRQIIETANHLSMALMMEQAGKASLMGSIRAGIPRDYREDIIDKPYLKAKDEVAVLSQSFAPDFLELLSHLLEENKRLSALVGNGEV